MHPLVCEAPSQLSTFQSFLSFFHNLIPSPVDVDGLYTPRSLARSARPVLGNSVCEAPKVGNELSTFQQFLPFFWLTAAEAYPSKSASLPGPSRASFSTRPRSKQARL